MPTSVPRSPARWQAPRCALVLYTGDAGNDDVSAKLDSFADTAGHTVTAIRVDPLVDKSRGMCSNPFFRGLVALLERGFVAGIFAAPPCATVSARRSCASGGDFGYTPRVLRHRLDVLAPLPGLTRKETTEVLVASHFFVAALYLCGLAAWRGLWHLVENPTDPEAPHPSFWVSFRCLSADFHPGSRVLVTMQCPYGCPVAKPTGLWTACRPSRHRSDCQALQTRTVLSHFYARDV